MKNTRKAFTLIEMLVVIGIIGALMAASIGGYSAITKAAQRARLRELVSNTSTALIAYFQDHGSWPKAFLNAYDGGDGLIDQRVGFLLARRSYPDGRVEGYMSLAVKYNGPTPMGLMGVDRLGVVSPWAIDAIKRSGDSATPDTPVSTGGKVQDHILHFAIDVDGDGITEAKVGGQGIKIRAPAAVWSAGRDGKMERYSRGSLKDDVYSWTKGQTQGM